MKREFTINIILLLFINILIKPAYIFGIETEVQNIVGTEAYGMYFAYFNFVFLFQFINDPGLQNYNAQLIAKNRESVSTLFPDLLMLKFFFSTIFIILVFIGAYIIKFDNYLLLLLIVINSILSTLFLNLRGIVSGLGYYRLDTFFSALDKLLMLVLMGFFLYSPYANPGFNIFWMITIQLISYLAVCILLLFILFRKVKHVQFDFSTTKYKNVLKNSLVYIATVFLLAGIYRADTVILGLMTNDFQVGLYSKAYRFLDASNMVILLFTTLLVSVFSALSDNKKEIESMVKFSIQIIVVVLCCISFTIYFNAEFLLSSLYDVVDVNLSLILKIISLSIFIFGVANVFGALIISINELKKLNFYMVFILLISIVLNYILIPTYQVLSLPIVAVLVSSILLIAEIYISKDYIKFNMYEFLNVLIFIITSFLIFYIVKNAGMSIFAALIISNILTIMSAFVFKILNIQELYKLKQIKS